MEVQNNAVLQFALWLKKRYPKVYAASMARNGLSGLGDTAPTDTTTPAATTSWLDTISNAIKSVIPAASAAYVAKQTIDVNVERAKAGLPPIDSGALAPQVNVSLPPAQMAQITSAGKYALYGVGVLGLLFIMSKRKR